MKEGVIVSFKVILRAVIKSVSFKSFTYSITEELFMKKELCPWERRELGCDERYVEVVSQKEEKEIDKALGMINVKVRLTENIYQYLIDEANKAGLNLHAFIRNKLSSK